MKAILVFSMFLLSVNAWSQSTLTYSLTFQQPVAIGEFDDVSDTDPGAGARFSMYFRPAVSKPFQFGLTAGLFHRGEKRITTFIDIAGFRDLYEVTALNSVLNAGIQGMWEFFPTSRIRPFAEVEIGGNDFYSSVLYELEDRNGTSNSIEKNDQLKHYWALYLGGSLGLNIGFGKEQKVGMSLKCSLFKGTETYYNAEPKVEKGNQLHFHRLRSSTDMIIPQVGIWLRSRNKQAGE